MQKILSLPADRPTNRTTNKHEAVSTPAPAQPGPSPTPVTTPAAPTIPRFPGYDPSIAPEGYEWRGQMPQGSEKGAYFNPQTGETLHLDLNHPYPIGPHWDYRNRQGIKIRIFPD